MFTAVDIANRALERERWARDKLARHAGRAVRIEVGPASQAFAIDDEGRLHESEAAFNLRLTISPLRLPALLAQPERWGELVAAEGDAALASTLSELALALPLFVEQVMAKAFGPIAGQGIADLGRGLLAFPGYAAQRFGESFTSYVDDEARLVVGATEARITAREIAALAERVDAVAVRIDALDDAAARDGRRRSPPPGRGRNKQGAR